MTWNHLQEILNAAVLKTTNEASQSMNAMVQRIGRTACGERTVCDSDGRIPCASAGGICIKRVFSTHTGSSRTDSWRKASVGADGYDAWTAVGDTVQIKTNRSSGTIGFRGDAKLLLAIQIDDRASWREIYYGDFQEVKRIARYSKRDNKFTVTREALGALGSEIASHS